MKKLFMILLISFLSACSNFTQDLLNESRYIDETILGFVVDDTKNKAVIIGKTFSYLIDCENNDLCDKITESISANNEISISSLYLNSEV